MIPDTNNVINNYKKAYEKFGNSPAAVLVPKGRQKERFTLLTKHIQNKNFSILDFGCGLGALYPFLQKRFTNFQYTGVDIVNEFIHENIHNYPGVQFVKIKSHRDITKAYDYILASGVFNIQYTQEISNEAYIFSCIKFLFQKTNIALSIDFMHDDVDYQQEMAHHQNIIKLYSFVVNNLSKRIIIDRSVFPYEFTITIFKDECILRPQNLYMQP